MPRAVLPASRDLVDHPLDVHPDDRVTLDQLSERSDRMVPQGLPVPGLGPLGVPGQPRLQVLLSVREPTRRTLDVNPTSSQRHARDPSPRLRLATWLVQTSRLYRPGVAGRDA